MANEEVTTPGADEEPMNVESLREKMARITGEPVEENPDSEQSPDAEEQEQSGESDEGETQDGEETEETEQEETEEPEESEKPDPKLTEHVQKRINKLTAKRKEAEERATAVEAELAALKARNEELEAQVTDSFAENAINLGIAPQFLTKPELAALTRDQELAQQERFFMEKAIGGEPFEDPKTGEEYSPKQLLAWYHEVRDERQKLATKVYAIKTQRTKEMMDALELGRKALKKNGTQPGTAAPVKAKAKPPQVPGPPSGAPNKPPITSPGKPGFDGKKLADAGYTRDALAEQMLNLVGAD